MNNDKKTVVYVDGSAFTAHPSGGIAHYAYELCRKLSNRTDLEIVILLFRGEYISKDIVGISVINLPFSRRLYSLIWKYIYQVPVNIFLPHSIINIVLYLNFAPSPTIQAKKTISLIHDLAFIHLPETIESRNRKFLKQAVARSLRRSDAIGFPSVFTKNDFLKHYNFKGETFVAYPGYDPPVNPANQSTLQIPSNFILNIGTLEPRKNISALCRAYVRSTFYSDGWPLLIAGKKGWGDVRLPNDSKIIHIDTPTDEERDTLIHKCRAFIFPSLFEGFGMPVIEAMYQKKTVISSSNSSLGEIVNKSNAYVINNPPEEDAILSELEQFHSDLKSGSKVIEQRISTAYRDCQKFEWSACADEFYKIMNNPVN